jgi:S-DNA-T family DNA segregation ATPase FtsK/SpoIIIE
MANKKQQDPTTETEPSTPAALEPATGQKRFLRYSLTFVLLGVVSLAWLSLVSFSPADPPAAAVYHPQGAAIQNRVGIVGAYLAWGLRYWVGLGSYAALVLLSIGAFVLLAGKTISDLPWRLTGLVLVTAALSAGTRLHAPFYAGEPVQGPSGILGTFLGDFLIDKFGDTGSWIVLGCILLVGLMLAGDNLLRALGRKLWHRRDDMAQAFAALRQSREPTGVVAGVDGSAVRRALIEAPSRPMPPGVDDPPASETRAERKARKKAEKQARKDAKAAARQQKRQDKDAEKQAAEEVRTLQAQAMQADVYDQDFPQDSPEGEYVSDAAPPAPPETPASKRVRPKTPGGATVSASRPAKPKSLSSTSTTSSSTSTKAKTKDGFPLPPRELLETPKNDYTEAAELQAAQRKLVLQRTLDDFGVDAKVVGYQTGPVITLFEVSLAPGVKVSSVANLATDIARSLAVPAVRIVPPRFGKDTVGIEVPNLDKEIVRLAELMDLRDKADRKMQLPLYLGKDAGGEAIVIDLAKAPHMLIAGTTGSGKSVCINTIIMSLLLTRTPEDVRFILVDPKMVEMAAFEKLPHLLCPTINDMKKAEEILEWATVKMDERYEILREARVKNLAQYNALSQKELYERFNVESEEEKARIPTSMPSYVIVIDELADLMMTSSKEVESYIIRIAQKARAVGIHLVLATQRPSANVVTGLIKSNMPCRISFKVASGQESRIVLDSKGAEVLLGQGDMLVLQPGTSELIRAQGTFVDDSEIYAVVKELESAGEQSFDPELMKLHSRPAGEISTEKDDLFDQAVEVVLASGRGSVSLLQRRLSIGYGRASRIIDQMAEAGLLGTHKGSQARECLMTLEEWHEMQAGIEADQTGANSYNGQGTSV